MIVNKRLRAIIAIRNLQIYLNPCKWFREIDNTNKNKINFPHGARGTIISRHAKIGKNVTIFNNVLIGDRQKTGVTIEDNVIIFAYSQLIGNITIGKNSVIGVGTYVNRDVPANTVVHNKKELIAKELGGRTWKTL